MTKIIIKNKLITIIAMQKEQKDEINVFLDRINLYINGWKDENQKVHKIEKDIVLEALRRLYLFVYELEENMHIDMHDIGSDISQVSVNRVEDDEKIEEETETLALETEGKQLQPEKQVRKEEEEKIDIPKEVAQYLENKDKDEKKEEKSVSSLLNYIDLEALKKERRRVTENKGKEVDSPSITLSNEVKKKEKSLLGRKIHAKKKLDEDLLEDLYEKAIDFFSKTEIKSKGEQKVSQKIEDKQVESVKEEDKLTEKIEIPQTTIFDAEKLGEKKAEEPVKNSLNDLFSSKNEEEKTIANVISNKKGGDIKNNIDINQRIAFVKNLFDGNDSAYNQAIKEINESESENQAYEVARSYEQKYDWTNHEETKEQLMYCIYLKFKNA